MVKIVAEEREKARKEFYRVVGARLDARIERGEEYTSTSDLTNGYESLHAKGFGADIPPSQSVAQVLSYARYKERLFYARHSVTHTAQRSGPGRGTAYRLYLRADATPPKDYVLVPIETDKAAIGEYIAAAKGAIDSTVHVTTLPPLRRDESGQVDFESLTERLSAVIQLQAALIDTMVPVLLQIQHSKVA